MQTPEQLKRIKELLVERASQKSGAGLTLSRRGCCTITLGAGETSQGNVTRDDCREVASQFPGAHYSFEEDKNC